MPNVYCRTTKISNAIGRSEYISNKTHKQEEVIIHEVKMTYDWKFYHDYELNHQKNPGQKQNEAREIMFPLPNELASKIKGETTKREKETIKKIVDDLVQEIIGENHDYEYAVHWNHTRTNLHAHVMFTERQVLDLKNVQQKIYAKDIWQDPITHKLCKKGNGKLVHKKGDLMFKNGQPVYMTEPLSAKDIRFKNKSFMVERDIAYKKVMAKYGYMFDINDRKSPYLSQKKLYQGTNKSYIEKAKAWNKEVKRYNLNVKNHIRISPSVEEDYISIKKDILDNVKEANRAEKKITEKAISMVKSMADYVENKVLKMYDTIDNGFGRIYNWWTENREDFMHLKYRNYENKDNKELLEKMKLVKQKQKKQLKTSKDNLIKDDMKKYNISYENAKNMIDQSPNVKKCVCEIADEINEFQEKYKWRVIEKQKVVDLVYKDPKKIVDYLTRDYNSSRHNDIKPILEKLKTLHGDGFEMPKLETPYRRKRHRRTL